MEELPLWIHSIDLGNGLRTPGYWPPDTQVAITEAIDALDFRGKRVLDVGCLDGLWSFEAERRGAAEVYAIDLTSQARPSREPYFRLACELLNSKARYFPDLSVFDVGELGRDDFDIVLYLGVYYHLRDPVLSFARLRQVMPEGATLLAEGQAIDVPEVYARFFYRDAFQGDRTNWWIPSVPCLREWVECSFFEIESEDWRPDQRRVPATTGRSVISATAVSRADPKLACPDRELERFDLNAYE